ncbi:MAG: peptidase M48 [Verrucomicrobia bacterium]|nr:MAG: peptidase M48 [Verrucomicrobiota bacterium]
MATNVLINLFIIFLVLKTFTELVLNFLNRKEVLAHRGEIPESFREFIDLSTYEKSVKYTLAKNRFSFWETIYDAMVLGFVVLSGFLPWLFYGFQGMVGNSLWGQAFTLLAICVVMGIFGLPFEWYSQFRLEERFGFNKSTIGLWVMDKLKGLALMFVIGMPILWIILKLFMVFPDTWWIWGFIFLFVFQILMLILYPRLIMPLFNKLEPLKEGELKDRLMQLAHRTGFRASTIQVMDGSKRSGHSNAFFTGFGKFRRIVLFDTLVEQLTPVELEAVLAHEIGHFKKGHVPKMLIISAIFTLIAFGAIAWVTKKAWFFESFGFEASSGMVPALILFVLLSSLITFWFTPFMNMISRKHEYEADDFAKKEMGSAQPLILSLRKLSEKNLANLTPHKVFSAFYYSHPTLIEREKAMRGE